MRRLKEFLRGNKEQLSDRVFLGVLAAKLAASCLFGSAYFLDERFIKFVSYFLDSGLSDPWTEFMRRGVLDAFPYSATMLAALALPMAPAAVLFGGAANVPHWLEFLLMRVPMLAADIAVYLILCRWFLSRWKVVVYLYWCSPVLFYVSYAHGQIDAIPTAFLFASLAAASQGAPWWAGALLGTGIGAKFHIAVAVPLIGFFLAKGARRADRTAVIAAYLVSLAAACAVCVGLPMLLSEGYRVLVLGAKEIDWVYDLGVVMPKGSTILLCPAVLLALLLHFFSYDRISRDLLVLYTGLVFTTLIVLVTPMPGWAYWSVPFLCYFLIRQDLVGYLPYWAYTVSYVLYFVALAPNVAPLAEFMPPSFRHAPDIMFSVMQTSLALVVVWVYRVGVRAHARYRALRRSIAVGIGGDSASGKHTLAEDLALVVGPENTVRLHGDDYHRWERGDSAWEDFTHLHPRANYLRQPVEHLHQLKSGLAVVKSRYDHATGTFTEPGRVEPNSVILFEGLHPFVSRRMRDAFDVKVYLETDESLRKFWKVRRDVRDRGHAPEKVVKEIERRRDDSDRYIQPQGKFADWVVAYAPVEPLGSAAPKADDAPLRVRHTVSSAVVEIEDLVDELTKLEGGKLKVDWSLDPSLERQAVEFEGRLSPAEVAAIAARVAPDLSEFVQGSPRWQADLRGLSQLVFVAILRGMAER